MRSPARDVLQRSPVTSSASLRPPARETVPHLPAHGVKLAHTSAVEQGLAGEDTFAKCRHSFLTWMAGTHIAQLCKQGTDLEQMDGIERRLLRNTDNAAYCQDLLKTLGFSWFSREQAAHTSKGDAGPPSIREVLVGSAPPQPTTSPVTTAHMPATSPTTSAQVLPSSTSAGQEVGGSAGLENRQEATPEVSRDAHGEVHPTQGEVPPTHATVQPARGYVHPIKVEVPRTQGGNQLPQREVQPTNSVPSLNAQAGTPHAVSPLTLTLGLTLTLTLRLTLGLVA
eukprot:gene32476-17711_t